MTEWEVEIEATALCFITVEAANEEEARQIAEVQGAEIENVSELSDWRVKKVSYFQGEKPFDEPPPPIPISPDYWESAK